MQKSVNLKKIIICSVAIALILCIGVFTLVMALVPVGYNDIVEKPTEVYIYNSNTNSLPSNRLSLRSRDEADVSKINKIYDLFNDGFQQNALSAMFRGELKEGNKTKYTKSSGNSINKNKTSTDKFTVVFYYNTKLKVTVNERTYEYQYVSFEVDNDDIRELTPMAINSTFSSDALDTIAYDYSFEAKLNLSSLYDYLYELVKVFE